MSTSSSSFIKWPVTVLLVVVAWIVWEWRGKRSDPEQSLRNQVEFELDASKQQWFDGFHPVGTATSVKVHEARRVDTPNGRQAHVRFTLYWSGPITTDGFTKINAVYDGESQRWVGAEILETNGATNAQAAEGIGTIFGALLAE